MLVPCISAASLLAAPPAFEVAEIAESGEPLLVPCVSVKPGRGRQPPSYGLGAGCTTCRKPPRYRDNRLVNCVCGAKPNRRAAPFIVRYIEDAP